MFTAYQSQTLSISIPFHSVPIYLNFYKPRAKQKKTNKTIACFAEKKFFSRSTRRRKCICEEANDGCSSMGSGPMKNFSAALFLWTRLYNIFHLVVFVSVRTWIPPFSAAMISFVCKICVCNVSFSFGAATAAATVDVDSSFSFSFAFSYHFEACSVNSNICTECRKVALIARHT